MILPCRHTLHYTVLKYPNSGDTFVAKVKEFPGVFTSALAIDLLEYQLRDQMIRYFKVFEDEHILSLSGDAIPEPLSHTNGKILGTWEFSFDCHNKNA